MRSSPSSAATIEEPSLTTRVMAGKVAEMGSAIGWGALAASSLVIGAALSFARDWPTRQVGYVLAFGAGALISAVSFELAAEGIAVGGAATTGIGLGVGALTYYLLDGLIARHHATGRGRKAARRGRAAAPPWPSAPSSTASPSSWCWASTSPPAPESASRCWSRSSSPTCRRRWARPRHGQAGEIARDDPAPVAARRRDLRRRQPGRLPARRRRRAATARRRSTASPPAPCW